MGFTNVRLSNDQYVQLKTLCEATGHKIGHHLSAAVSNYMQDVGTTLIWNAEQTAKEIEKKRRQRKTVMVSVK